MRRSRSRNDDMAVDCGFHNDDVRSDGRNDTMRKRDQFDPPPTKPWVYAAWLSAAFVVWGMLMGGAVTADASPCVNRSAAHAAQHGETVASDSRYHVLRGELPTCGQQQAQDTERQQEKRSEYRPSKKRDYDKKSRFCRKRWYC